MASEARPLEPEIEAGPVVTVVVTPERLHGECLKRVLADEGVASVAAVIAPRPDLCRRLRRSRPHVVVLDTGLRQNLLAARQITRELPATRLIAVSAPGDNHVASYVEAGVVAVVTSDGCAADLVSAVRAVCCDGAWCSGHATAVLMKRLCALARDEIRGSLGGITPRELELLELIDAGLSNREIAAHLCIEPATVKNHVHNILRKLGVGSRADAAAVWRAIVG